MGGKWYASLFAMTLAAFTAVAKESGSWKWALFLAVYTTALAWVLAFGVYQVGSLCF